jgi:predicted enzyme related to lactoylglutathione lyase
MAIIHGVVVDCRNAAALGAFWKDALGWDYRAQRPEEGWVSLQPPDTPHAGFLSFGEVPEGKVVKNRVHLDIRPAPGVGWEEEQARLVALGATVLRHVGNTHNILADPEGNEFCLLNPAWYA